MTKERKDGRNDGGTKSDQVLAPDAYTRAAALKELTSSAVSYHPWTELNYYSADQELKRAYTASSRAGHMEVVTEKRAL